MYDYLLTGHRLWKGEYFWVKISLLNCFDCLLTFVFIVCNSLVPDRIYWDLSSQSLMCLFSCCNAIFCLKEVDIKAGGGKNMTIGEFCRLILTRLVPRSFEKCFSHCSWCSFSVLLKRELIH